MRHRHLLFSLLLTVASGAVPTAQAPYWSCLPTYNGTCGAAVSASNYYTGIRDIPGVGSYRLHANPSVYPAYASGKAPVVLNLHGYNGNALSQQNASLMNATADAKSFIVIYPEGNVDALGARAWNAGDCCKSGDDVTYIKAIIADIPNALGYFAGQLPGGGTPQADLKRVHATGVSNGGFMSYRLACDASDVIAAVAPVAGVMSVQATVPCALTTYKPPVIHFHALNDTAVRYGYAGQPAWAYLPGQYAYISPLPSTFNGAYFRSVEGSTAQWAERHSCLAGAYSTVPTGVGSCFLANVPDPAKPAGGCPTNPAGTGPVTLCRNDVATMPLAHEWAAATSGFGNDVMWDYVFKWAIHP